MRMCPGIAKGGGAKFISTINGLCVGGGGRGACSPMKCN